VPAEGNGDLQTLICVLVARPRRCSALSNPVPTKLNGDLSLRMKTLFCGWPVMVHDMHMKRRRITGRQKNTKARYTLATKLNSTRSTLLNRQQIGNNLNIYESRDDPVTSRNKSINFKGKCIYITQFM